MPSLNGQISFTVKFDLTGSPTLKIQASTTIPGGDKPNLVGYFYIKQPDLIDRTGSYTSPDVVWNGSGYDEFSIPLRPASDGTYQRGTYQIIFYASCTGYTPGSLSRQWAANLAKVSETLTQLFDLYTPSLSYRNDTVYTNGDYAITSQDEAWAATAIPGTPTPSTTADFDLAILGIYYDSIFAITHTKNVTYQNNANTWFTILQRWTSSITAAAYIPAAMTVLLGYLDALKTLRDANSCSHTYDEVYEDTAVLYSHIRNKVCQQVIAGLKDYFDQFYRLTHNFQNLVYINTNSAIPPYDFTTGCGGGGGTVSNTIVVECVIGNAYTITGGSATVTGLTNGGITISSTDFANKRVTIIRGNINIPGVDPLDGSNYFTKVLASNNITLSSGLVAGEYIKIQTIPS